MTDHLHTVGVDFDGVIHTYASGWTGYEPLDGPEPGALEFIQGLIEAGFRPVVMSSRAHTPEAKVHVEAWLRKHGFPAMEVTNEKVLAVAYVDDRAIHYETGSESWGAVTGMIHMLAGKAALTDVTQ